MIEYRYKKDKYLHMRKIILFRLIGLNVTYGSLNGIHLTIGFALGPFEPSINLSIWKHILQ